MGGKLPPPPVAGKRGKNTVAGLRVKKIVVQNTCITENYN